MKLFSSCILLLCIVFIAACQKEIDTTIPASGLVGDSNYISKIYLLDSISQGQADTTEMVSFEYDVLKRIKKTVWYDYAGQVPVLSGSTIYLYHGSDTFCFLAYNPNIAAPLPGTASGDSTFYFYGNDGNLLMDSIVFSDQSYLVNKYIPVAGGIKHIKNDFFMQGGPGTLFTDTSFLWQTFINGHLVRELEDDLRNTPISMKYEYDTNINPWKKLNVSKIPTLFFMGLPVNQAYDNNNITKTIFEPGSGQVITTVSYSYLANGYPYRASITDNNGIASLHYYVYTVL